MVSWRESSGQIVIAIIGSSLLLTTITSLASFLNKPLLDISVDVAKYPSLPPFYIFPGGDENHNTTTIYRISLVNNGHSPAKDVRLTMTYPGAKVIHNSTIYENENITLVNQTSNSVVAILPRLNTGTVIIVENTIKGYMLISNYSDWGLSPPDPRNDFDVASYRWIYGHNRGNDPFSISVTYDQGAKTYDPPVTTVFGDYTSTYFNTGILKFYIPIILAVLLFGIAVRHKRKSISRCASNVLKDIIAVEAILKDKDRRAILSFNKDHSQEQFVPILDNYDDSELINKFYSGLEARESKISKALKTNDSESINIVIAEENSKCIGLATSARSKIRWVKFYKFDLILLIPAIALGALFITFICEGLPYYLQTQQLFQNDKHILITLFSTFIITVISRSLGTYFILRWILHATQGYSLMHYVIPSLFRNVRFFAYCSLIMGFPCVTIYDILFNSIYIPTSEAVTMVLIAIDFGRMLLLTWIVSRRPHGLKEKGNLLEILKRNIDKV